MTSADSSAAKPGAITREALTAAGLAVLRREGLDALSMRKVAAELGVRAASLYYHVQDKEQLLDLLADGLTWDTRRLTGTGDWSDCLRDAAHAYYRHLHANRDTARLMAGRRAPGPNLMHLLDAMLGRLHAAGFTDADAALATLLIANYVQGYVLQEQQPKAPVPASGGSGEKDDAAAEECRAIADTYPNLAGLMAMTAGGDAYQLFEFGVERIIDGLRTRLPGGSES